MKKSLMLCACCFALLVQLLVCFEKTFANHKNVVPQGVNKNGKTNIKNQTGNRAGAKKTGRSRQILANKDVVKSVVPKNNIGSITCSVKKVLGGSRVLLRVDFAKEVDKMAIFKEEDGTIIKMVIRSNKDETPIESFKWVYNNAECKELLTIENFYYNSEQILFVSIGSEMKMLYVGTDKGIKKARMLMGSDPLIDSEFEDYEKETNASKGNKEVLQKNTFVELNLLQSATSLVVGGIDLVEKFFVGVKSGLGGDVSVEKTKNKTRDEVGSEVVLRRESLPKKEQVRMVRVKNGTGTSRVEEESLGISLHKQERTLSLPMPIRSPFIKRKSQQNFEENNSTKRVILLHVDAMPVQKPDFLGTRNVGRDKSEVLEFRSGNIEKAYVKMGNKIENGYLAVKTITSHTVEHFANEPKVIEVQNKARQAIKFVSPNIVKKTHGENKVIVIDPGHGGKDVGSVSRDGIREKDIAMLFADILRKKLVSKGFNVVMTRKGDYYVMLHRRVMHARVHKPAFMISIHADGSKNKSARGASAYTLSDECAEVEAKKVMDKKKPMYWDSYFYKYGDVVGNAIISMMQYSSRKKSQNFVSELLQNLKTNNIRVHASIPQYADFAVLKGVDVPSALIELGFLTNEQDAKMLLTRSYLNKFADSIVDTLLQNIFE